MDKIKKVYELPWLIKLIYRESDKLLAKVVDPTQFEERCLKDIGDYLSECTSHKINKNYLIRLVNRKYAEAIKRHKKEESYNISDINYTNEDGEELEYEFADALADIESEVLAKEMIALLARGNQRDEIIAKSWADGNTNTASISRLLAQSIGGNAKSHRVYIHRFRQTCQEEINSIATTI